MPSTTRFKYDMRMRGLVLKIEDAPAAVAGGGARVKDGGAAAAEPGTEDVAVERRTSVRLPASAEAASAEIRCCSFEVVESEGEDAGCPCAAGAVKPRELSKCSDVSSNESAATVETDSAEAEETARMGINEA